MQRLERREDVLDDDAHHPDLSRLNRLLAGRKLGVGEASRLLRPARHRRRPRLRRRLRCPARRRRHERLEIQRPILSSKVRLQRLGPLVLPHQESRGAAPGVGPPGAAEEGGEVVLSAEAPHPPVEVRLHLRLALLPAAFDDHAFRRVACPAELHLPGLSREGLIRHPVRPPPQHPSHLGGYIIGKPLLLGRGVKLHVDPIQQPCEHPWCGETVEPHQREPHDAPPEAGLGAGAYRLGELCVDGLDHRVGCRQIQPRTEPSDSSSASTPRIEDRCPPVERRGRGKERWVAR
mmetsp:Transcript_55369/g.131493  ORF Transcript_55369/g.131493 Transcript_55369/m.131493 type:complete len:291 (-) Transcript_55369:125-997(-)